MPPSVRCRAVGRQARPGTRGYRLVRTDGARIDVEVASRDLRDDPTVRGFVLTLRDVTDQRKLEQELTHRASHDSLTGLANRVLFRDRVERALAVRTQRGSWASSSSTSTTSSSSTTRWATG